MHVCVCVCVCVLWCLPPTAVVSLSPSPQPIIYTTYQTPGLVLSLSYLQVVSSVGLITLMVEGLYNTWAYMFLIPRHTSPHPQAHVPHPQAHVPSSPGTRPLIPRHTSPHPQAHVPSSPDTRPLLPRHTSLLPRHTGTADLHHLVYGIQQAL